MKRIIIMLLLVSLMLCGCSAENEGEADIFNYIRTLENPEEYIMIGSYKGVKVDEISVNDADIAEYKAELQSKYAYYKPLTDRTEVSVGDNVHISYVSYLNNVAFEGGSGSCDLTVGDGTFIFPSVESSLIGAKVGSTVGTAVTVPDDYFSTGLRGKTLTMKITVDRIQEKEKTVPELDATFVKEHLGLDSLEAFEDYVKKTLDAKAMDEMMTSAWKAVLANCEMIRYPDGIVEKYVDAMYAHYTEEAAKYGAKPEIFIGSDKDAWVKDATAYAEDYYKSEIAMYCILDREIGRNVSDKEYKKRLAEYAEDLGVSVDEVEKNYEKDEIITSIHWDKVMEFIWENRVIS
ncbi:MAG: hypothetical protein IKK83_02475 [Clostridia bacterium]|nr:hypothetical protein [Clostridia bacterium]